MINEVRNYELAQADGQVYTVPLAREIVPGLLVYRIPDGMHPSSPHRWRLGHAVSGRAIADTMTEEDALKTAEVFGPLADWTQDMDTMRATINAQELFSKARAYYPIHPADPAYRIGGDASRNGIYTDADIEEAAREAKADGFSAYDVLIAMSHTVPWMGLDTEDFNEAHDRIVQKAGLA
ncbi:hypothetical protein ACIRJM_23225 [Streptomyces sp. NPDC102405]|uniref:hypothetical protein n=1 Tax=Streptomyces sp. NPDC102405 TaxID=3366170 RepID=UPI0037F56483